MFILTQHHVVDGKIDSGIVVFKSEKKAYRNYERVCNDIMSSSWFNSLNKDNSRVKQEGIRSKFGVKQEDGTFRPSEERIILDYFLAMDNKNNYYYVKVQNENGHKAIMP